MRENSTARSLYEDLQPIQGVILGLIASPGIVANLFAIVVTAKLLRQQSLSPNVLVFALACMDVFGIVTLCIPTWLCYINGHWVGGEHMCKFQGFMTLFCTLGTGFMATSMSVDRFVAVQWPLLHRQRVTVKVTKRIVFGLITMAAVISSFPVVGFGSFVRNLTGTYCTLNWFAKAKKDIVFSYMYAVIGFFLVLSVIVCNINIVVKLCKREDKLRGMSRKSDKQNKTNRTLERQFTKMMIVISVIFLICWTPFMIRIISNISGVWISWSADLQASRLLLLNLVLDPFTYVLTRQHYRQALCELCCACRKKKGSRLKANSSLTSSSRNIFATNSSNINDVVSSKEVLNKEEKVKTLNFCDVSCDESLV